MIALLLALSTTAFAAEPCANFAKAGAIKAYKAEVGTVQGSDGIQYTATLIAERGPFYSYVVTISDNNEDGETWEVDYSVNVEFNGVCKIGNVKKIASR